MSTAQYSGFGPGRRGLRIRGLAVVVAAALVVTAAWWATEPDRSGEVEFAVTATNLGDGVSTDTAVRLRGMSIGTVIEQTNRSGDESLSAHYNTPVHHGGHLYGIDGRQEYGARLRCIEWKSGKVRWTSEKFGCACLLKADGIGLAVTEAGDLVLFELSPDSYKELARAAVLEKPVRAASALANGRLYARDGAKLVCVDLKK